MALDMQRWKRWKSLGIADNIQILLQLQSSNRTDSFNMRRKTYMSKGGQVHAVAGVLSQPLDQAFAGCFPVDGHDLRLRRGLGGGRRGGGRGRTCWALWWRRGRRGGGGGDGGVADGLNASLWTDTQMQMFKDSPLKSHRLWFALFLLRLSWVKFLSTCSDAEPRLCPPTCVSGRCSPRLLANSEYRASTFLLLPLLLLSESSPLRLPLTICPVTGWMSPACRIPDMSIPTEPGSGAVMGGSGDILWLLPVASFVPTPLVVLISPEDLVRSIAASCQPFSMGPVRWEGGATTGTFSSLELLAAAPPPVGLGDADFPAKILTAATAAS